MRANSRAGRGGRTGRPTDLGSRRLGFGQGGGVQNVADWAFGNASLDILFTNRIAAQNGIIIPFSPLLTTTRGSTAYADNSAGVWSSFATDTPRLTDKGLLVEEARTNGQRNNTATGAATGTPGTVPTGWAMPTTWDTGVARTIVATGTENGVDYIDVRYVGTASAGGISLSIDMEADAIIAALSGQQWTQSAFLKLVAGSFTNVASLTLGIYQEDAGGAVNNTQNGSDIKASITSTLTRFSTTYTLDNGTGTTAWVVPRLRLVSVAGAIDFTLRIGWPQLELGAFATSPIRTTSAAATRAADQITSLISLGSEFSLYAEFVIPYDTTGTFPMALQVDDGSNNERANIFVSTATDLVRASMTDGGVSQADFQNGSAISYGSVVKGAAAFKLNDVALSANGTAVTTDTVATMPSVDRVRFGRDAGGNFLNGYLRRAAVAPTRDANAVLQARST